MESDAANWKRWSETTKAMLGYLSQKNSQIYSISIVPEELRKENDNAYVPKVVSIGPRYRGRRELLPMEEMKLRYMVSLLHRTKEPVANLETCMTQLLKADAVVRASYVEEIKLDSYELATIMLHDGCFLLQLFFANKEGDKEQISLGRMEMVLSDLKLVENQIPLGVLNMLWLILGPKICVSRDILSDINYSVGRMAMSLFSYPEFNSDNEAHLLDLVHLSFVKDSLRHESDENNQHTSIAIGDDKSTPIARGKEVELNRCATRLLSAGIKIKPQDPGRINNCVNTVHFGFSIRFNYDEAILEIPQLRITQGTETEWRNFIAWEHHLKVRNNSSIAMFTLLAILFSDLICCTSDVQLLKDRNVILVDDSLKKSMSNRDLKGFFRSITIGVNRGIIDSSYSKMFDDLDKYSATNCATRFCTILWHYFARIAESIYDLQKFLRRGYNFAAAILTLLTFIQTIYTVLSYYSSK